MTPPPFPGVSPKAKKIPTWVWVLTFGGVLFMVGLYSAAFWGFSKVQDLAKEDIAKANPDFEMLYFARDGQIKVKHKPSGREFLVKPPSALSKGKIEILHIATREVKPVPAWLQLKDVAPNAAKAGWDRAGDTGLLLESIEDLFLDHDFVTGAQDDKTLTACNPKRLECVVIHYGILDDQDNRSWYSATFFTTP